jgi:hypothetical protein
MVDVTFCLQHGHVLLRDGYACIHAEAERFIASFNSAIMNPLPQGSGFFSFDENLYGSYKRDRQPKEKEDEHEPALRTAMS